MAMEYGRENGRASGSTLALLVSRPHGPTGLRLGRCVKG